MFLTPVLTNVRLSAGYGNKIAKYAAATGVISGNLKIAVSHLSF